MLSLHPLLLLRFTPFSRCFQPVLGALCAATLASPAMALIEPAASAAMRPIPSPLAVPLTGPLEVIAIERLPAKAEPNSLQLGDTKVSVGGYIKVDALLSRFSDGELAQGPGRDFYLPNSIPTGNGQSREFLDLHAKETRLFVKSETLIDGHKLGTHVEVDFIVNQSQAANEIVTNAYTPGFRRAFVTFDRWLVGQEWSTFLNLATLPETLDFVAFPSEGTVFTRQPQVRYTRGGWQLALENPETSLLPAGGGAVSASSDSVLPDAIGRYQIKRGDSEFAVAGLVRQLKVNNAATATTPAAKDSTLASGVSLSGRVGFGADDLRFQLTAGEGIGRYLALGTSADAAVSEGELDTMGVIGGYLAYKHAWGPQWRSTVTFSMLQVDNDTAITGTAVTRQVQSVSLNLLYSPVAKFTVGVEYRHAERQLESGAEGSLDRVQMSAKYSF